MGNDEAFKKLQREYIKQKIALGYCSRMTCPNLHVPDKTMCEKHLALNVANVKRFVERNPGYRRKYKRNRDNGPCDT